MNGLLAPGDLMGHYRVLSLLGSGGMGQVYLAEDVRLGRKLALKVLWPKTVRDPERLRRFEREARTVSSLNHPNILTIYDVGEADGTPFIATEYIDGLTLRALLERGRLALRHTLDVALQVGQALMAAHAAGVIHRDVKPENVMIRPDGYVKVLDFGLAKLAPQTFSESSEATQLVDTRDGLVMGSFSYMAPEQARGADLDARCDQFAFGVLLYEMIAGEPPFRGASAADVVGALLYTEPAPLTPGAGVPDALERIVMTALRKNRDERYQAFAPLLADLRAIARALDSAAAGEVWSPVIPGGAPQAGAGDLTTVGFTGVTPSLPHGATPPAGTPPTGDPAVTGGAPRTGTTPGTGPTPRPWAAPRPGLPLPMAPTGPEPVAGGLDSGTPVPTSGPSVPTTPHVPAPPSAASGPARLGAFAPLQPPPPASAQPPASSPRRSASPGRRRSDEIRAPGAPARRRRSKKVIESLAVLPLVNQSREEELDYLSDGLTESLINNLSQIPRLRVMARSTVFRYKGHNPDPLVVGRDLDVRAVVTGHLVQRGDAFIVGAELVDVEDGAQLWGTQLKRRPSDVFVLQHEISRELADALRLRLTRDEKVRLNKAQTANAEAYQLYLRGRYFLNKRIGDALKESRALFQRAIDEDPQYALAYAGLADCCSLIAVSFRSPTVGALIEQARSAARQAMALDDTLAEGHASLAFVKFRFDWDWDGAERAFTRALDLNPGHAPARQWYAMFLASQARFDAALVEMRRALDFDPLSMVIQSGIGRILHFAGRYDEAINQYDHVLQTSPGFAQARIDLAFTHLARGEFTQARQTLARAEELLLGPVSTTVLLKGIVAVREGRVEEGRRALATLQERYDHEAAGPDDLAMMAAVLGDWPVARERLREACARRSPFLGYTNVEPSMAVLFDDEACAALLGRHGFGRER